jgi:hypothetical protein
MSVSRFEWRRPPPRSSRSSARSGPRSSTGRAASTRPLASRSRPSSAPRASARPGRRSSPSPLRGAAPPTAARTAHDNPAGHAKPHSARGLPTTVARRRSPPIGPMSIAWAPFRLVELEGDPVAGVECRSGGREAAAMDEQFAALCVVGDDAVAARTVEPLAARSMCSTARSDGSSRTL